MNCVELFPVTCIFDPTLVSARVIISMQFKQSIRKEVKFKKISYIFIFIIDKMKRKLDFKLVSIRRNITSKRIYHGSSYIHIFILKRRKNKSIENVLHIHLRVTMRARVENTKFSPRDWRFLSPAWFRISILFQRVKRVYIRKRTALNILLRREITYIRMIQSIR